MNTMRRICSRNVVSRLLWIVTLSLALALAGCKGSQEISLQTMQVAGPLSEPPVRVTDHTEPGQVHFTPGVTIYRRVPIKGRVALNTDDNLFPGSGAPDNFRWETPKFSASLDGEVIMSRHTALTAGLRVSSLNSRSTTGWTAGLGFFREDSIHAIRLDIGVQMNSYLYDGLTLITEEVDGRQTTTTYHDIGENRDLGTYVGLTYNTRAEEWPVNLFLNASFSLQPLTDYTPHTNVYPWEYRVTDRRASISQWLLAIAPGLYVRPLPGMRMLAGARFLSPMDLENQSPQFLVMPFVQLDVGF